MKNLKTLSAIATIAFAVLTGCTKEGKPGKDGRDGNANVIGSNTVTLNNWSTLYDDGTNYTHSSTVTWSSITQSIVDKGIVAAYIQTYPNEWYALPYTEAGAGYSSTFNFAFTVGTVEIQSTGYDNGGSVSASTLNSAAYKVRIVAIPSSQLAAHPDVDYSNYKEVVKEFGLKE